MHSYILPDVYTRYKICATCSVYVYVHLYIHIYIYIYIYMCVYLFVYTYFVIVCQKLNHEAVPEHELESARRGREP